MNNKQDNANLYKTWTTPSNGIGYVSWTNPACMLFIQKLMK